MKEKIAEMICQITCGDDNRYRVLGILAIFLISGGISSICYFLVANVDKSTWNSIFINIMEIGIPIAIFGMFFFTGLVFFIDDEPKRW